MNPSALLQAIRDEGWALLGGCMPDEAQGIIASLGRLVHWTDVRPALRPAAYVLTNDSIAPHTDHHRVDLILWYCRSPAAAGGDSILVDTRKILDNLDAEFTVALRRTPVRTHIMFPGDEAEAFALHGTPERVYYAPWLVVSEHRGSPAVAALDAAIDRAEPIRIRLAQGDVLVIDNRRMLHGRTRFESNSPRWLTRAWLVEHGNTDLRAAESAQGPCSKHHGQHP